MALSQVNALGGFGIRFRDSNKSDEQSHLDGTARDLATTFLPLPVLVNNKHIQNSDGPGPYTHLTLPTTYPL